MKFAGLCQKVLVPVSPPTRGRGLKFFQGPADQFWGQVAPHAGAWVEMMPPIPLCLPQAVAPHAGAWVEIARCPVLDGST